MYSTTTCGYSNPLNYLGEIPSASQPWSFASSTCFQSVDNSSVVNPANLSAASSFVFDGFFLFASIVIMVLWVVKRFTN